MQRAQRDQPLTDLSEKRFERLERFKPFERILLIHPSAIISPKRAQNSPMAP